MTALPKEQSEQYLKELIFKGIVERVSLPYDYCLTDAAFQSFKMHFKVKR